MSSSGTILAMTPLLPWRPAILSPTESCTLGGDVDLDHLQHAGGQLVAALHVRELALLLALHRMPMRGQYWLYDRRLSRRLPALDPLHVEVLDLSR
jgi:hypothetical protein